MSYYTEHARRDAMRQRVKKIPVDFGICPLCGSSEIIVLTHSNKPGYFYKGDKVYCAKCEHPGDIDHNCDIAWI